MKLLHYICLLACNFTLLSDSKLLKIQTTMTYLEHKDCQSHIRSMDRICHKFLKHQRDQGAVKAFISNQKNILIEH